MEHELADVSVLYLNFYMDTLRSSPEVLQSYFRQVLAENPWCDMNLPSWVYKDHGRIVMDGTRRSAIPKPTSTGIEYVLAPKAHSVAEQGKARLGDSL